MEQELVTESSLPPTARARISPIVWLNLLCLDAPFVAITWQWLFARSFGVSITTSSRAALFLTAWLIYLADRLADTWALRPDDPRSLRQVFCQRYRGAYVVVIPSLALIDLWIISRQLDRATVHIGMMVGAFLLVYLAVNYWLGKIWRLFPAKEICIGSLFAVGTITALLPLVRPSLAFIEAFLLFAALCSLNCISIAVWERELDHAQRKNSIATRWSRIRFCLRPGTMVLAVFAIASVTRTSAPLHICIGVSAALLGVLDWLGEQIQRDERTALADLVLLTPLFLLALGIA